MKTLDELLERAKFDPDRIITWANKAMPGAVPGTHYRMVLREGGAYENQRLMPTILALVEVCRVQDEALEHYEITHYDDRRNPCHGDKTALATRAKAMSILEGLK